MELGLAVEQSETLMHTMKWVMGPLGYMGGFHCTRMSEAVMATAEKLVTTVDSEM